VPAPSRSPRRTAAPASRRASRQRGATFAQLAILLASIGVIVLAVLQIARP
jgi:hypothetical protein